MSAKRTKRKKKKKVSQVMEQVKATVEQAKRINAVRTEVPGGENVWMWVAPAIPGVHGFAELRVTGIVENFGLGACPKGEPVFEVRGHFSVGALKQLLAGTMFRMRLRDWSMQELRELAMAEVTERHNGRITVLDEEEVRERIWEWLVAKGVPQLQARLLAATA